MVEISIIMNTCREDYPMVGLPNTFIFEPTVKTLNKQKLQNFELIIVDALYSEKRRRWLENNAEFPVKYVNAFPNRFLENGMCAISSQKNKGLIYAEGELVVFMDDCTMFPLKDWTERIWYWYEQGYWPMSLTYYFEGGKPKLLGRSSRYVEKFYGREYDKEGNFYTFLKEGEIVRDSRADYVNASNIVKPAPAGWFYGGSSASLKALLKINGLDEKFDGKKSLEDVDLGLRLEMAGFKNKFVADSKLWHIENWHKSVNEKVLWYRGSTPCCNYGLLRFNQVKNLWKANSYIITYEDCLWIRDNICASCFNLERCRGEEFKGKFFIECEGFRKWLELQEAFNLEEKRREIGM